MRALDDHHRAVSIVPEAPPPAAELPPAAEPVETALVFTGTGAEYFRIWVVNTLLTLLTLGIYSAWAKVRRTRYLWQNTRLDGFAFDYHARPLAILRGRILAFGLFAAYSYAFQFSATAGIAVVVAICAIGPWLFMRAQQFKLANTSWRGLRFGFDARASQAFRVVLPILLIWFLGTFAAVAYADDAAAVGFAQLPAVFALPWMHQRLKAYQHGHAWYGDRAFSFASATRRFYSVYLKGWMVSILGVIASLVLLMATLWLAPKAGPDELPRTPYLIAATAIGFALIFSFTWPYLAARFQQVVWSATHLGDVRFRTEISAVRLFELTFQNVLLTLLTLGLYWPFASMHFAKYRIECMRVISDAGMDRIAAGTQSGSVSAGGDSALDAFGLDLGL
jgi:uncharacterized membrane protein YjgN (DUF898 family)